MDNRALSGEGGGIRSADAESFGSLLVIDSTISGNSAQSDKRGAGKGGGILYDSGTTVFFLSTGAANSASTSSGGVRSNYATIEDSIVAGNEAGGSPSAACELGAYEAESQLLEMNVTGNGSGNVSSQPAGISCPGDCEEGYGFGTEVTLTAAADAGRTLSGWSGACSYASGDCLVTMDAAKSVTATFTLVPLDPTHRAFLPLVPKNWP